MNEEKKTLQPTLKNELLFYIFNDIKRTEKKGGNRNVGETRELLSPWKEFEGFSGEMEINKIRGSFLHQTTSSGGGSEEENLDYV